MKKSHWMFITLFVLIVVSFFGMNGYAQEVSLFAKTVSAAGGRPPHSLPINEERMFAVVLFLSLALINCMVLAKKYNLLIRKNGEQIKEVHTETKR